MFLLLSTTFLELSTFPIIICIILTNWNKMSKNYKLTAIDTKYFLIEITSFQQPL